IDWHQPQVRRDAEPQVDQALALPGLRAGSIDFEHEQAGSQLRSPLSERVKARSEDDVLPDATGRQLRDKIFDEASPGDDGGTEGPRERAHVRTAAPSVVWIHQLEADFVFKHLRC